MTRKNLYVDEINQMIGTRIYEQRLAKGMSRSQLAQEIGITHQQLQKYEKGENRISAGRLSLIADMLGISPDYFYASFEENKRALSPTQHQRMCLEVSRNFMKLANPEHQQAINTLVKSLLKEAA